MWRRCLGDLPFKEDGREVVDCTPEMRRIELQPGDSAVVLATDGLWDVMSDTDVVGTVTKARLPTACQNIAILGPQQNFTVWRLKWPLAGSYKVQKQTRHHIDPRSPNVSYFDACFHASAEK